jgi:hypothetical protein
MEMIKLGFVFTAMELSSLQRVYALQNFCATFSKLQYESWKGIPLLFSNRYSREYPGSLEVPFDFIIEDFLAYLKRHINHIKSERQKQLTAKRRTTT